MTDLEEAEAQYLADGELDLTSLRLGLVAGGCLTAIGGVVQAETAEDVAEWLLGIGAMLGMIVSGAREGANGAVIEDILDRLLMEVTAVGMRFGEPLYLDGIFDRLGKPRNTGERDE